MSASPRPGESRAPLGVILTAGKGTRLQPLTPDTPKSLVPLLNRPLAAYALELLASCGLDDIVVVVSPGDEGTVARAAEVAPPGTRLSVAVQHEPRGPGDAVLAAGDRLDGRAVCVLAVDTVLLGDAQPAIEAFLASDASAGLLLKPVEDPRAFGVAILDGGRVTHLEEKPEQPRSNLALVGLWLLAPQAIDRLRERPVINAKGESDLTATIGALVDEGSAVSGWVFDGEWLDGGTLEGLLDAQERLLAAGAAPPGAPEDATVVDSRLTPPVLVAPGARIEGSTLERVVVGAGAELRDVRLRRALVVAGARLEGGAYEDVVVLGDGLVAGPGRPTEA